MNCNTTHYRANSSSVPGDPTLVQYARQQAAGVVHLFNFVGATRGHGDRADWVNQALFAELLSRVEGDALESGIRGATERGLIRPESHGNKPGYVIDRTQEEVRMLLGEFHRLNGATETHLPTPSTPGSADANADATSETSLTGEPEGLEAGGLAPVAAGGLAPASAPGDPTAPRKRTRRGSRGGRNRRGGRGRRKPASSPTSGEAAD